MPRLSTALATFFLLTAGLLPFVRSAPAAPAAPAFLPGQPMLAGGQVIMMWLPVPGAAKYVVYLNDKKLAESPANQFLTPAPEGSGEFRYQVSAVDAAGAEGPKSAPGVIKVVALEAPKGVTVRSDPKEKLISLRWDPVKGGVIYNVYRAKSKDGNYDLITSVQTEGHKDAGLAPGAYFYKIAARDMAGKEGPRSEPTEVKLEALVTAEVAAAMEFKIQPTDEVARYDFLGDVLITQISDFKLDPERGTFWVAEGAKKMLFEVNPENFEVLTPIGPLEKAPQNVDFGPDGNLYVSTPQGTVEVYSRKGEPVRSIEMVKPPLDKKEFEEFWKGMPAATKGYGSTGGGVLCLQDELWVADQRFSVIEVFDYKGNLKRYIWEYTEKGGTKQRFSPVGEIRKLPDGNLLLTFPLAHYAAVVDGNMKEVFNIGKRAQGFLAGFIGIAGVALTPSGNLLLTDPGVNTMQVFDAKNGNYLYHLGGPEAKEDPGQPGRPFLDVGAIAFAQFDKRGLLFLYSGSEKVFEKRKITGDPVRAVK